MPFTALAIAAAIAAAAPLLLITRLPPAVRGWAAAAVPFALFVGFATMLPGVAAGSIPTDVMRWVPSLGVELAFRVDGLSLLMALLITGIGAGVFAFSGRYLAGHPRQGRFLAVLALFMAAMLGTVTSDHLIALFVFWELTSLTSFLLIGFKGESERARAAALQALLVTGAGGLMLLAAALLLGQAAGTFRLSEIIAAGPALTEHPLAPAILVLLILAAFTKSAQAPLHFWLPNAMEAPTPVSAYLHSATMVKLGVYLLARFNPVFGGEELWTGALVTAGTATMLVGALLALRETDLKRVLAYSTVVALGTLVMLLGLQDPIAATAAMTFLIVHALYKASLFLVAGIIDHETGTRDATRLGGLARSMPVTAVVALAAGLSMAGLPPFVGFVGKELLYEAKLTHPVAPLLLVGAGVLANAAMVVVGGILSVRAFLGTPRGLETTPHDPPPEMLAGPAALAAGGVLFGLLPGTLGGWLVEPAVSAVMGSAAMGSATPAPLALWHGFTPVLGLSVLTLALGIAVFLRWEPLRRRMERWHLLDRHGPERGYTVALGGFQWLAAWQTRLIQPGSLRVYATVTLAVIAAATAAPMLFGGGIAVPAGWLDLTVYEAGAALLLMAGAVAAVVARGMLAGIMAVGVVGFGSALVFLLFGAPDLAFTQFAVEVLFIVILTAVLLKLPLREPEHRTRGQRRTDAALAVGVGSVGALVMLAVLASPFDPTLGAWFGAASVPEAHGRNVVNVIIVDFRALDTLGEITVLGLAGLAALAILKRRPQAPQGGA
ncbi:putative monovalent cation/H+ antiporter subunit A [Azospirillum sp. RWY-5-1]|uniref:Monovalent cation/H+ antiporter subunit A n=1 Tax=Azospirillum oleiclasticum TaxID=2735135 RepID=A0ABX2TDZ7_9PROT|nr:putative monovalent cation/H+ antiporter subunit A [Azospirillum oleiclasticum]NYZ22287.1 putative monovalent cation/H+ antiporter subunit A [Azospirillum oleiclasticum]